MNGRVTLAAISLLAACNPSSAVPGVLDREIRVATPLAFDASDLIPREHMGAAGPAVDLFCDQTEDHLELVASDDLSVRLKATSPSADLAMLASRLAFVGLMKSSVDGNEIIATFQSAERRLAFVESGMGGVAIGPYLAPESGDATFFAARGGVGPALKFVTAARRNHWQLLIGGHVDVLTEVSETDAERLRASPDIHVVERPARKTITLILNPRRTTPEQRATLSNALNQRELEGAKPDALPSVVVLGNRRDERRLFQVLASRAWRFSGLRPDGLFLPEADYARRAAQGDFEAAIAPVPIDRASFFDWLLPEGPLGQLQLLDAETEQAIRDGRLDVAAERLSEFLIPLAEPLGYSAFSRDWCGDVKPSADSWRWISELRLCEDAP